MWEKNFIYKCDPPKNNICKKADCQRSCFYTSHKEFSADGKRYVYWRGEHLIEWREEFENGSKQRKEGNIAGDHG